MTAAEMPDLDCFPVALARLHCKKYFAIQGNVFSHHRGRICLNL